MGLETTGNALSIARIIEPHVAGVLVADTRNVRAMTHAKVAPLTLAQLQTRLRDFIHTYNTEHRHSALGGLTPAQKWASLAVALDVVEPDRLRWMLMADQTRRVLKDGIHFGGEIFIAPELARVGVARCRSATNPRGHGERAPRGLRVGIPVPRYACRPPGSPRGGLRKSQHVNVAGRNHVD